MVISKVRLRGCEAERPSVECLVFGILSPMILHILMMNSAARGASTLNIKHHHDQDQEDAGAAVKIGPNCFTLKISEDGS